jgi:hypothetical protein
MPDEVFRVSGNIVDALNSVIYAGTLVIENGKIDAIEKEFVTYDTFIVPGLSTGSLTASQKLSERTFRPHSGPCHLCLYWSSHS